MIDAHLHVVNFLQHRMRPAEVAKALELNSDGSGGPGGLVVFGLPVKKKWSVTEPEKPTYYLDDNAPCSSYPLTDVHVADLVTELAEVFGEEVGSRVAPLICGFDPTDRLAVEHLETMADRFDGWRGVGEVLLRHDDLTEITYGENARAGHPALDEVLEFCAGRRWPMTFHQDASSAGRSGQREYVGELRRMLDKHHRVPLVWAHAGASRRIQPEHHTALLRELFESHPNLHVDISWVTLDRVLETETGLGSGLATGWAELIAANPDRFVLGSDAFGSLDGMEASIEQRHRVLETLDPTVRDLISTANARRLWWHE